MQKKKALSFPFGHWPAHKGAVLACSYAPRPAITCSPSSASSRSRKSRTCASRFSSQAEAADKRCRTQSIPPSMEPRVRCKRYARNLPGLKAASSSSLASILRTSQQRSPQCRTLRLQPRRAFCPDREPRLLLHAALT